MALEPDLLIIQEITETDAGTLDARATHWVGLQGRKGKAVFGFTDQPCVIADSRPTDLRWFLPVQWNGFFILASWAHVVTTSRRYVRVMLEALEHYRPFLLARPSIIIGDLNSNIVLDHKHRGKSHTDLVARLDALEMSSAYHHGSVEAHDLESTPTFFLYRHREKPYHFDYAFGANGLLDDARLSRRRDRGLDRIERSPAVDSGSARPGAGIAIVALPRLASGRPLELAWRSINGAECCSAHPWLL